MSAGLLVNASVTFDSSEVIIKCHAFVNETHSWKEAGVSKSVCSVGGDADVETKVETRGRLLAYVSGEMKGDGNVPSPVCLFATVHVDPPVLSKPARVFTFDGFASFGTGLDSQRASTALVDHLARVICRAETLPAASQRDLESFARIMVAFTTGMAVNPEPKQRAGKK